MSMSNFPNGFKDGITINNVPLTLTNPGEVFFVSNADVLLDKNQSVAGVDQAGGGTFQRPFRTIDFANGQCTADRGDIIFAMPGHVETIDAAAALDLDIAGVSVIGIGRGTKQPRLDFTDAAGTVEVNADNITIHNINFHANVPAISPGLSILTLATDTVVQNCTFDVETTTTDEFAISINLGVGCDRTIIENCIIDQGLGDAAHAIKLVGATAGCTIKGNRIVGDYSVANIGGITTLSTEVYIEDNFLMQGGTANLNAQPVIEMLTGTTGIVRNNDIVCDVATFAAMTVADTMSFLNNQRTDDIDAAKVSTTISASVTVSADA